MNKIVYLLGAGASAQAMPLVADFNQRMLLFYHTLSKAQKQKYRSLSSLDIDLKKLIEDEKNHYSIDTLAKKYWLVESMSEYEKLKALLTCFFIYESFNKNELNLITKESKNKLKITPEDAIKQKEIEKSIIGSENTIDKRYDALLAAVLRKSPLTMPENISFISWNYDDQLEYAAWNVSNAGKEYKFFNPSNLVKPMKRAEARPSLGVNLIKLNGGFLPNIDMLESSEQKVFSSFINNRKLNPENLKQLDKLYSSLLAKPSSINIQFAWEHSTLTDNRVKLAKEKIYDATDLVVIGYSFPNYNIEIDQAIIGSKEGVSKNIYIEDCIDNFNPLIERLKYLKVKVDILQKKNKIKHHSDLKTFCLPPSFFIEYENPKQSIRRNSLI